MLEDLSGQRFGIVGMGRSGISAAGLVRRLGGNVLVSDSKPVEVLWQSIDKLVDSKIEIEVGEHSRIFKENFDTIVVSPGVQVKPEWLLAWRKSGAKVWSELELASQCYNGNWVGVTGSNGKTTTVTLITEILNRSGVRACAVGNIGEAWSSFLPKHEIELFVVEVSSFQMEYTETARPTVCVILNVLANHLDRHGRIEVYGDLKMKLSRQQQSSDFFVYNADDSFLSSRSSQINSAVVTFGTENADFLVRDGKLLRNTGGEETLLIRESEWKLVGRHNLLNAAAAAAASTCVGVSDRDIRSALLTAEPVEHRIEFVREVGNVRYINDSKSTNLIATITAIDSIDRRIVLLFGGRPKLESFASLGTYLGKQLSHIIVFGEAIAKVSTELPDDSRLHFCRDLTESFQLARKYAIKGEAIMLSPGCASYDQYENFEQRGKHFKQLVEEIK